jgi:hypothetical protein
MSRRCAITKRPVFNPRSKMGTSNLGHGERNFRSLGNIDGHEQVPVASPSYSRAFRTVVPGACRFWSAGRHEFCDAGRLRSRQRSTPSPSGSALAAEIAKPALQDCLIDGTYGGALALVIVQPKPPRGIAVNNPNQSGQQNQGGQQGGQQGGNQQKPGQQTQKPGQGGQQATRSRANRPRSSFRHGDESRKPGPWPGFLCGGAIKNFTERQAHGE